jgi:hypothetical protein
MPLRRWLRLLVIHPLALVVVAVAPSYFLAWKASPGADTADDVWPFLYLLAISPLLSTLFTGRMLLHSSVSARARAALVVLSLGAGIAAAFVGVVLWYDAIEIACQGRYECPL